jgi:hypothetical protein
LQGFLAAYNLQSDPISGSCPFHGPGNRRLNIPGVEGQRLSWIRMIRRYSPLKGRKQVGGLSLKSAIDNCTACQSTGQSRASGNDYHK